MLIVIAIHFNGFGRQFIIDAGLLCLFEKLLELLYHLLVALLEVVADAVDFCLVAHNQLLEVELVLPLELLDIVPYLLVALQFVRLLAVVFQPGTLALLLELLQALRVLLSQPANLSILLL